MLRPFGPNDLEIVCGEGGGEVERGGTGSGRRLPVRKETLNSNYLSLSI